MKIHVYLSTHPFAKFYCSKIQLSTTEPGVISLPSCIYDYISLRCGYSWPHCPPKKTDSKVRWLVVGVVLVGVGMAIPPRVRVFNLPLEGLLEIILAEWRGQAAPAPPYVAHVVPVLLLLMIVGLAVTDVIYGFILHHTALVWLPLLWTASYLMEELQFCLCVVHGESPHQILLPKTPLIHFCSFLYWSTSSI